MIQTKIARINSPTEVILAAGSQQGVEIGMIFVIYEQGDEIHDPETGESLGCLELVKGRVKVAHVQEKFSHATTFSRQVSELYDPRRPVFLALLEPREVTRTIHDQLTVEGAVAVKTDLTVRVGDLARSVA